MSCLVSQNICIFYHFSHRLFGLFYTLFKLIILQNVYLILVPSHKSKHTSTHTEEVRMKITRVFSCRMNELSSDSIFVFWLEGTQHHLFHIRGFFSSSSKTTCWQFWTETTVTDLILMLLAFFLEYYIMYRIMNYELSLHLWLESRSLQSFASILKSTDMHDTNKDGSHCTTFS